MSDDKLKQDHVFVKNNVGSLALHKAKQEIGGIKMDNEIEYEIQNKNINLNHGSGKNGKGRNNN